MHLLPALVSKVQKHNLQPTRSGSLIVIKSVTESVFYSIKKDSASVLKEENQAIFFKGLGLEIDLV